MKTLVKIKHSIALLGIAALAFTSCKKTETTNLQDEILSQLGAVAVSSTSNVSGLTSSVPDSIYAMDACKKDHNKTKITADQLPTSITSYLSLNYDGYSFIKAFSTTKKGESSLNAYVVAINFNGKPVAIKFNASGAFEKVLELREGGDMKKPGGHHEGGCFDNRDGKQRDSLAVAALPQKIKQYFTTNYPTDTLKGAWVNKDASIIVVSKNVKYYATAFKTDGTFINRIELPARPGKDKEISQSALPATVATYLTTTYPNYVFKKAFADASKGYLVIIDANMTKYAVAFDVNGSFISAKSLR